MTVVEPLRTALEDSEALRNLAALLKEKAGLLLFIVARPEMGAMVVYPDLQHLELPRFCAVLQSTAAGRQRCAQCRCMVATRTRPGRVTEFSCHGGIASIVAPVCAQGEAMPEWVAKTSGFIHLERPDSWRNVRRTLDRLNTNLAMAKAGYLELPRLSPETVRLAGELLRIAAGIVAEQIRHERAQCKVLPQPAMDGEESLREAFEALCSTSYGESCHVRGESRSAMAVNLVVALVQRNPSAAYTMEALAKSLHLTPNHLSTVFHRCCGMPFSTFLLRERVAVAMRYLKDPRLTVSDAAYAAGFHDVSYFCRCFRRETGKTPKQWRSQ